MEIQLLSAYDRAEDLRPLYREYAELLLQTEPVFTASLAQQNYDAELQHLQEKYGMPGGRLYLLLVDGEAAGCVGLRKLDNQHGELKRLYVRPRYRGAQLGAYLVRRILSDAREIGYRYVRLDTLPGLTHAIALYRTLGFYEIECYYDCLIPHTLFMEIAL